MPTARGGGLGHLGLGSSRNLPRKLHLTFSARLGLFTPPSPTRPTHGLPDCTEIKPLVLVSTTNGLSLPAHSTLTVRVVPSGERTTRKMQKGGSPFGQASSANLLLCTCARTRPHVLLLGVKLRRLLSAPARAVGTSNDAFIVCPSAVVHRLSQ